MSSSSMDVGERDGGLLGSGGRVLSKAALLLSLLGVSTTARADELRIGQFWKKSVTFEDVEGGRLIYSDSVGEEREADLSEITGLRASAYPVLGKAHEAMDKGDDREALKALGTLGTRVRHSWLRQWIAWHVMQCHARNGHAKGAVAAYLELVRLQAESFYLGQPPVQVLEGVEGQVKREIHGRLVVALERAAGASRSGLEAMLATLGPPVEPNATTMRQASSPPTAKADHATKHPMPEAAAPRAKRSAVLITKRLGEGASVVELPSFIRANDPVTQLLRDGKFHEAVETVDRMLGRDDAFSVSMRWYQRGVAWRALADKAASGEASRRLYLHAGLDFMRVVVYFSTGRYRGPSLVEAGDVHQKIGRVVLARRLFDEAARPPHAIEEKDTPRYYRRLKQLLDQLPDGS